MRVSHRGRSLVEGLLLVVGEFVADRFVQVNERLCRPPQVILGIHPQRSVIPLPVPIVVLVQDPTQMLPSSTPLDP